jgi:hemolysin activation/secretion protein
LSEPLPEFGGIRSSLSAGLDFKKYSLTSYKTNVFQFTEITLREDGTPNPPVVSTVSSRVPTTSRAVEYLPFSLRWDANRRDAYGSFDFGLGYAPNFSGGLFPNNEQDFQSVAGSPKANGYYHVLSANLSRDFTVYTNWVASLRADGQWANQPLISNEQFGLGGLNTVRGYREGEVFGDTGWHLTLEQKTPPHLIGNVYARHPLTVRASAYMDYGEVYLLDPQGRNGRTALWGGGFGGVFSIGPTWEARLLFSWPLLNAGTTQAGHPRFDFSLSAQF